MCLLTTFCALRTRTYLHVLLLLLLFYSMLVSLVCGFLLKFIYYLDAGRRLLARAVVTVSRPVVAIRVQLDLIGEFVVKFNLTLLG